MIRIASLVTILLLSLFSTDIATYADGRIKRFYRDDIKQINDTAIAVAPYGHPVKATVEVCFSFPGKNEGFFSKNRNLSLIWNETPSGDYYSVSFSPGSKSMDDAVDSRYVGVTINRHHDGIIENLAEIKLTKGVGLGNQENVATLTLSSHSVLIGLGHREPITAWEGKIPNDLAVPIVIKAEGDINIAEVVSEYEADLASELTTSFHIDDFLNNADDSKTGNWIYLDRKTDSDFAKIGGRYSLGIIDQPQTPGSFLIIYLDGAEVNSSAWKEGMIKGRLKATPFENHFDLEWYDAKMDIIDKDAHADFDDQGILTLSFPLMNSTVRFYKNRL